jgi:hypothetical protein
VFTRFHQRSLSCAGFQSTPSCLISFTPILTSDHILPFKPGSTKSTRCYALFLQPAVTSSLSSSIIYLITLREGELSRYSHYTTARTAEQSGFDSRQGQEICSFLHDVQTGSKGHPASYTVSTGRGLKRQGRGTDHSPPSRA